MLHYIISVIDTGKAIIDYVQKINVILELMELLYKCVKYGEIDEVKLHYYVSDIGGNIGSMIGGTPGYYIGWSSAYIIEHAGHMGASIGRSACKIIAGTLEKDIG